MIEVLFRQSEAASMKEAKAHGQFPGSPDEVICLNLMLDIGDIRHEVYGEERKALFFSGHPTPEDQARMEADWQETVGALTRLTEAGKAGEPVRIWYSETPYSLCGLYFTCRQLQPYTVPVSAVKLPEWVAVPDGVIMYTGWYEVAPEDFAQFLSCERPLPAWERRMYTSHWNRLMEDNSPLRAIVNGMLVGVPEDFYDFLLLKSLSETPKKEIAVIGDTIGHYHGAVSDRFYADRLDKMIAAGKVIIAQDAPGRYDRMICLPG